MARPRSCRGLCSGAPLLPLERYDHIFSTEQATALKDCLQRLAGGKQWWAAWRSILIAAHDYEQRRAQLPMRKERVGDAIRKLSRKYGRESLGVAIVRGDDVRIKKIGRDFFDIEVIYRGSLRRGRPRGGYGDRDEYIACVCRLYQRLTGKRPTVTWNPASERPSGPLHELLRAALAPEVFYQEKQGRFSPLTDEAVASAVKRVLKRDASLFSP